MSNYANIDIDVTDEELYGIIKVLFDYPDDLLEDLKGRCDSSQEVVFQLVLSRAVTKILTHMIENTED